MSGIRWGVLGTSRHAANTVIPAIQAAGNVVAAVGSRSAEKGQQFAANLGIPKVYTDYQEVLDDPTIQAVYIPLPNHLHKEWAIRAAQAGKHVLCEKPIALNAAEAEEMVAAFRAAGLKLAEAFQWRHHPQAFRLRDLVQEGAIGDLRLIDGGLTFMLTRPEDIRMKPETGGGALYDLGCYPVSFARFITGQEPLAVTAQMHWSESGVDDQVVATMEFPGGVLAHFNCSFLVPLRRYFEVTGTKGGLRVNKTYNPKGGEPYELVRLGDDLEVVGRIALGSDNSYTLMARDFSAAIHEGRDLLYPPEDGIAQMRVLDAIYEAARTGRRVEVAGVR